MKNLQELRNEEARIQAMLDSGVKEQLLAIPGVVHVSVGLKEKGDYATNEFCIRVYVAEKKDINQLTPGQVVPAEINGVKTDVNQVALGRKLVDNRQYLPIRGGIQIRIGNAVGTIGCLATDNATGNTVMVTCNHVGGFPAAGVNIFQPDIVPATPAANLIGVTTANAASNNSVDCAAHTINPGIATSNIINNFRIAITGVAAPVAGARVYKAGRTTGLTRGKIVDTNAVVSVDGYPTGAAPAGTIIFNTGILKIKSLFKYTQCCCCDCYELDSIFRFSDQGDSGSLIVMSNGQAVGLLFADNEGPGDPIAAHETYACSMTAVQTALNVTVNPTTADAGGPEISSAPADVPEIEISPTPDGIARSKSKKKKTTSRGKKKDSKTGRPPRSIPELLADFEEELNQTETGVELLKTIQESRSEIMELINRKRPVTIIWQRNSGPAFTAHFMNSLKDPDYKIPHDVNGVTLKVLLIKMAAVLEEYGSPTLRQAIAQQIGDLIYLSEYFTSTNNLLSNLKHHISV